MNISWRCSISAREEFHSLLGLVIDWASEFSILRDPDKKTMYNSTLGIDRGLGARALADLVGCLIQFIKPDEDKPFFAFFPHDR